MKYKVIKRFRDKHTRKIILPGDTFVCDENERIKNLLERGLIEGEKKPSFDALTKKELKGLLEEKGIEYDAKANKSELIELLQGGD